MNDIQAVVRNESVVVKLEGAPGASLYEHWLAEGNSGSLTDFINWFVDQADITVAMSDYAAYSLRSVMAAVASPTDGQLAWLMEAGRQGHFRFDDSNLATEVAADTQEGIYVAPGGGSGLATDGSDGAWVRQVLDIEPIIPEWWGAKGDAATNDQVAFEEMVAFVQARGGGWIKLQANARYIVGAQDDHAGSPTNADGTGSGLYRYTSHKILYFTSCVGLKIDGNGAALEIADNLRHGTFNADGSDMASSNGYTGTGIGQAYHSMIDLNQCKDVEIKNIELHGNSQGLNAGGRWGDTGWQIGGNGIRIHESTHITIDNVLSHWHPADGIQSIGLCENEGDDDEHVHMRNCQFERNGRQGWSHVGGKGYMAENCSFSFSGKASKTVYNSFHPFSSAPGAGLDIEAEGDKLVRNTRLVGCTFACNTGCGLVADSGPGADATFINCDFIGDNNWSIWPLKPRFRFVECEMIGMAVNPHNGGGIDEDATKFTKCTFTDDPAKSPTGVAYITGSSYLFDMGGSGAVPVTFTECSFRATVSGKGLPFGNATYINCNFVQDYDSVSFYPFNSHFYGRNVVADVLSLDTGGGTMIIEGNLFVNGLNVYVLTGSVDFGTILVGETKTFNPGLYGYISVPEHFEGRIDPMPHHCTVDVYAGADGYVSFAVTNVSLGDQVLGTRDVYIKRKPFYETWP